MADRLEDAPVFVISVAAQLAGLHPQTLRQYDRMGLVSPRRTRGRGRRYSPRDIDQLREIQRLSQEEGVNLAGIKRVLELQRELDEARRELEHLRVVAMPGSRVFHADTTGRVVVAPRGARVRVSEDRGAVVLWSPQQATGL